MFWFLSLQALAFNNYRETFSLVELPLRMCVITLLFFLVETFTIWSDDWQTLELNALEHLNELEHLKRPQQGF